jgi:two-component system, LytTR family, sensor kinase
MPQMTKKQWLRVGLHVGLWALFYFGAGRVIAEAVYKDNSSVVNIVSLVDLAINIAIFYLFGYFVFPKFFYKKKFIVSSCYLIGVFYLTYIINYYMFKSLLSITNGYTGKEKAYVKLAWDVFVKDGGWFGCFTSFRLAAWNYLLSLFIPTITLSIKSIRDIIAIQKKSAKLELDKIVLERDKLALEQENLQLEVNFLKSQINPHFLFNTLNSVYAQIVDLSDQAADQILQLSSLMRYGLYESNSERVLLTRELEYIQNYIDLERSRLGSRAVVEYNREGDFGSYQIAPLLLISFVENAFKHGVNKSRDHAYVRIDASMTGHTFVFQIENSVGQPGSVRSSPVGGVGLVNTRKRLDLLFPNQYQLAIEPSAQSFRVRLRLTLQ